MASAMEVYANAALAGEASHVKRLTVRLWQTKPVLAGAFARRYHPRAMVARSANATQVGRAQLAPTPLVSDTTTAMTEVFANLVCATVRRSGQGNHAHSVRVPKIATFTAVASPAENAYAWKAGLASRAVRAALDCAPVVVFAMPADSRVLVKRGGRVRIAPNPFAPITAAVMVFVRRNVHANVILALWAKTVSGRFARITVPITVSVSCLWLRELASVAVATATPGGKAMIAL